MFLINSTKPTTMAISRTTVSRDRTRIRASDILIVFFYTLKCMFNLNY